MNEYYIEPDSCSILNEIERFKIDHQGEILRPSELKQLFQYYKAFRNTLRNPLSNLKSLNWIIRYIIEETYFSKEEDSDFIVQLIQAVVENDGNVCSFLPNLSHLSEVTLHSQTLLEFMLRHSNRRKARFWGHRLVALPSFNVDNCFSPVELALKLQSPNILHCLLRYGAIWSYLESYGERVRDGWNLKTIPCPSTRLCADIISYFISYFTEYNPKMSNLSDLNGASRSICKELITCGHLILRDTPMLEFRFILSTDVPEMNTISSEEVKSIITKLDGFVPGLLYHFSCPLSLKHSCKLQIRKILNQNWELPNGIRNLPLPINLLNYIDLLCD